MTETCYCPNCNQNRKCQPSHWCTICETHFDAEEQESGLSSEKPIIEVAQKLAKHLNNAWEARAFSDHQVEDEEEDKAREALEELQGLFKAYGYNFN